MKKTILSLGVLAAFIFAFTTFSTSGCSGDPTDTDTIPHDSVETPAITNAWAVAPADMSVQSQEGADTLSWRTFIAMCWPAKAGTCSADTSKNILSGKGPLVWETYLSSDQVFVASGQPASWCAGSASNALQHVPADVLALGQKTGITRFIHLTSKTDGPHDLDQASGGPLVDQNGRFARYEKRMNQTEYNYIVGDTLWTKSGQESFAKDHDFSFPNGSMEFKAAWKVMGANDDTTKFYCIRAIVYNDDSGDPSPGPNPVTLGLVGLHIAHKTPSQQSWVWSTFEHVDNDTKSFYNPASNAIPNQPITGSPDELDSITGQPLHLPTQVVLINPGADPIAPGVNTYFQGLLAGSVWANYELVGTQWIQFEALTPSYLANSVQETYLQGPSPAKYGNYPLLNGELYYKDARYKPFSDSSSSSCLGCHYIAKSAGTPKKRSDFSFMMGEAR